MKLDFRAEATKTSGCVLMCAHVCVCACVGLLIVSFENISCPNNAVRFCYITLRYTTHKRQSTLTVYLDAIAKAKKIHTCTRDTLSCSEHAMCEFVILIIHICLRAFECAALIR